MSEYVVPTVYNWARQSGEKKDANMNKSKILESSLLWKVKFTNNETQPCLNLQKNVSWLILGGRGANAQRVNYVFDICINTFYDVHLLFYICECF